MANAKGSKFHPARISNRQKMERQREHEKHFGKKKKRKMKPIDITKQNWSTT